MTVYPDIKCEGCGELLRIEDWKHHREETGHPTYRQLKVSERNWNYLKSWHEPHDKDVTCPFCNAPTGKVKNNGEGFFRCKGECKNRFFLLRCTE